VRAIDIIMADGQRYWIEPADSPITSASAMQTAFASDPMPPTVHYDTEEFLAALVSFGSMGVISSFVIEVVEQFALSQQVGWTTWSAVKQLLASRALFNTNPPYSGISSVSAHPPSAIDASGNTFNTTNPAPEGLEIIINPYRLSCDYQTDPAPEREVLLVSRAAFPIPNPINGPKPPGPDQLALLAALNDFKGNLADSITIPTDVRTIITASSARTNSNGFLTAHTITDTYVYGIGPTSPLLSIEVVLPTRNGIELAFVDQLLAQFDAIIAANLADKFAGIFSVRYCQASQAYLAMQNFGPYHLDGGWVCHIEIGCLHNVDSLGNRIYGAEDIVGLKDGNLCESSSEKHLDAFEQLADQWGARLHWGQMSFTDSHNPKRYSNYANWQAVRARYTTDGAVRVFDSDFTTRYGISANETGNLWSAVAGSLLPAAPTVAPPGVVTPTALAPPTAFLTAQNTVELVAIGNDGQVCWTRQEVPGSDLMHWSWVQRPDARVDNYQSGNVTLAPQFGGRVAVGFNQDSHPELFAWCASDSGIYHSWRNLNDNTWGNWTQLKGDQGFSGSPAVASDNSGVLVVVAGTASGHVRWTSQNDSLGIVGWNDWQDLPWPVEDFYSDPCIARNGDGVLEVFAWAAAGGAIVGNVQSGQQGSSPWGSWSYIGPTAGGNYIPMSSPPMVGVNEDGTLELFAVNEAGQLLHIRQNSGNHAGKLFNWDGCQWSPVVPTSAATVSGAAGGTVLTAGGALHVPVLATNGSAVLYHQTQSGYVQQILAGHLSGPPSIVAGGDGSLLLFAKGASDLVLQSDSTPLHSSLLFYDPRSGTGSFYTADGLGNISLQKGNAGWRGSWYLIVPVQFAVGPPSSLLFYDPGAGVGEFYSTDGQGNISLISSETGWSTDWSRIIAGNFTGGLFADLLFYDPINQVGEFYATDDQGTMSLVSHQSGWRNSWSVIVPANLTDNRFDDLLFYDPVAGQGELYTTDGLGNISLVRSYSGWRNSWIFIIPGNFTGGRFSDLLFIDPFGGVGELYTTDGQGNLTLATTFSDWQGWSFAVPGRFTGSQFTDLFLYNPVTGTARLYAAGAQQGLALLQSYTNWFLYLALILSLNLLLRRLVADHPVGQHDVTRPPAGPAEADENPVRAHPVLSGQALAAMGQRQRRRARRAVFGRVTPVSFGIVREPAPVQVRLGRVIADRRHPPAAFRFSIALRCSFFSASACGLNREDPRSMKSMANEPPESNLFFSHGRSTRSRKSRYTPSGSSPRATAPICSLYIRRSMVTPTSERPRCSTVRSVIGPWVIQAMMSWPST
jgi:hypothetical protein